MAITGIKGMNDILPGEVETWQYLEETARRVFSAFGYSEIRVPVVEKTELFCRSIGEVTDIVEKEMYTFEDKSNNSITLRPEGTASVMRSFIQHKMNNSNTVNKLYYIGPMFRYERPQKGRYRQFHQIGAEVIGVDSPLVDAQVLAMLWQFLTVAELGDLTMQINSLGCPECRPDYRKELIDFLEARKGSLCEDCLRRIDSNPLRVLDCKATGCREACLDAPSVLDHLCSSCDEHFVAVKAALDSLELPYSVNDRMVRGLDYYTKTTFEILTENLGAQNAVAAGGRYDGLVESLGGPKVPGIGFAIGLERLVLLKGIDAIGVKRPKVFFAALGGEATKQVFPLIFKLQQHGVAAEFDYAGKSLKSQMKRADKLGAEMVVIIGEDELASGKAVVRHMETGEQQEIDLADIVSTFTD